MTHIFGSLHNAMYKLYDYNANKLRHDPTPHQYMILKYNPTPHQYMILIMVSVVLHPSSFIARFLIIFYINTTLKKVWIWPCRNIQSTKTNTLQVMVCSQPYSFCNVQNYFPAILATLSQPYSKSFPKHTYNAVPSHTHAAILIILSTVVNQHN